ncbi:hypothetical protein DS2_07183 [Catenovulum agarivorans DS-2]|uniref:Beta-ketoacyl synthase N-terminal domain-containing protein n=1 Tax=Catenovulum agarivorans DS-2 TaxID=1328313 RepID=W7QFB6_9ALTE|nr:hypothetical protein [Catenovulum agarivorans]EWH10596.1 hypothetical protein DS2_07183 [Catenovulum agarivorans DS-2]
MQLWSQKLSQQRTESTAMPINIIAQSEFTHARDITNKILRAELKQAFGINGRRLDNFTLAGLAAATKLHLNAQRPITGLIGCAEYFSVELLQSLLLDIDAANPIRPLDFVATVGNAANYYIAKEFNVTGLNLFIGSSDNSEAKLLQLAETELMANQHQTLLLLNWHEDSNQRRCKASLVDYVA